MIPYDMITFIIMRINVPMILRHHYYYYDDDSYDDDHYDSYVSGLFPTRMIK
jgi:hypothetical protein